MLRRLCLGQLADGNPDPGPDDAAVAWTRWPGDLALVLVDVGELRGVGLEADARDVLVVDEAPGRGRR